ncbi:MAG: hypothetical protein QM817_16550 [Archangium sp.]
MSPGGKLTVFMLLALAIFFAVRWVLARVLGPYPGPSADRPPDGFGGIPGGVGASDVSSHHGASEQP